MPYVVKKSEKSGKSPSVATTKHQKHSFSANTIKKISPLKLHVIIELWRQGKLFFTKNEKKLHWNKKNYTFTSDL
jgi:hypothetical protein